MSPRLLEYLRQPLVYLVIIVSVSMMIACWAREMKGLPWGRRSWLGIVVFWILILAWFLKR